MQHADGVGPPLWRVVRSVKDAEYGLLLLQTLPADEGRRRASTSVRMPCSQHMAALKGALFTPDLAGDLDNQRELCKLLVLAEQIAHQGRCKSTLR